MKVLVINSGSSSVKFQLFEMLDESVICKGILEKIGTDKACLKMKWGTDMEIKETSEVLDHRAAVSRILNALQDKQSGIIEDINEIKVVGHRVVHGGEFFKESNIVSDEVMNSIEICSELAPLHNPPNIRGINACRELIPDIPQVAVFDTAFHQTMPNKAYLYGLPYILYEKYKIRRYGFHGTSHQYASKEAARIINRPIDELKIITCHLGNGSSITAIDRGKSIDTTRGFTPLEGLIMGTRCGDVDPAIIPYLIEKERLSLDGIKNLMNKHSGVYGIAGLGSGDMRDLEKAELEGVSRAGLAREMFAYRVRKYIGAYIVVLGGVDIIVFTGGIGENDEGVREKSLQNLEFLGIEVDKSLNRKRGQTKISRGKVDIMIIRANEELEIARESKRILDEGLR